MKLHSFSLYIILKYGLLIYRGFNKDEFIIVSFSVENLIILLL